MYLRNRWLWSNGKWLKICGNTTFLFVLRRKFSIFLTKKKLKPKNKKIGSFVVNLLENSPICKRSHLTVISEKTLFVICCTNKWTNVTSTVAES